MTQAIRRRALTTEQCLDFAEAAHAVAGEAPLDPHIRSLVKQTLRGGMSEEQFFEKLDSYVAQM